MNRIAYLLLITFLLAACNANNVTKDDSLQKYFDQYNVKGTFGIYNNGKDQFTIYNLSRFKDSAYMPASTFKVVNALIALETGKVSNEKMILKWDGISRPEADWNQDLNLENAFKVSAVPHFQQIARSIGKDTMQYWLDSLGYGQRYAKYRISKIDTFWLDNTLKITADEQLGLMKKLFFDQLPFQKRTMRVVKEMMVAEKNANYSMSYKTGMGTLPNGNKVGWITGWLEENRHPHIFVLNVEGNSTTDIVAIREKILKEILLQLGYLKGKM